MLHPNKHISIDHFSLLKVVGKGAFGKVFLAMMKSSGKLYAIKKMRKDLIVKAGIEHKVMSEKLILSKLENPYLIKLYYAF